ncbi:hypothetical protein CASFOL_026786 [Castilleja foliolosa]|uniref:Uncharacterized protein n=1 Tax=Castilleja foliolosa TaxID=1961234 RepID=A0ABD3CJ32_9LAMI
MSKMTKRAVGLDLVSPYGVSGCEDAKTRLKHTALMQDFLELQKEVDVIRSNLDAGKQRKLMLAAEVRFLRKKYEYFVKTKTSNLSQKGEKFAQPTNLPKQTKHSKGLNKKPAVHHKLPPIPETKPKKKNYIGKERVSLIGQQSLTPVTDFDPKRNIIPVIDLNQKEIVHANDVALRNKALTFDLNHDNNNNLHSGNEVFMRRRAPIFDLNEISTGDEDFQFEALKFEEQNDLMLAVCRNTGEGPSHVGKRKISWQDPVALRV